MWRYYGFRFSAVAISRLPFWLGTLLAHIAGTVAFFLARGPRRTVAGNLRRVLGPGTDPATLRRATRQAFLNLARNYYDVVRLPRCSSEDVSRKVEFLGFHNLQGALQCGRGIVLSTAHLGNYELVSRAAVARGLSLTVLVERFQPERFWRYWMSLRSAPGLSFEPAGPGGLKAAYKALRQGGLVAIASDRAVHGAGILTNFMGEPAVMPTGAVELALRTRASLVPAFCVRTGKDRYQVYFEQPIPLPEGKPTEAEIRRGVDELIAVMERYIRKAPSQWIVAQRIWEHAGPSTAAPAADPQASVKATPGPGS